MTIWAGQEDQLLQGGPKRNDDGADEGAQVTRSPLSLQPLKPVPQDT